MRWAALVVLTGCALPANRASGTFAGRAWHGDVLEAEWCEHCGGGPSFTLSFSPPVAKGKYAEDGVFIEESSMVEPGMKPRTLHVEPDWEGLRISHGLSSAAPKAVAGELDIEAFPASNERYGDAFLRATFWARFADGSEVSGRIDGPVTISAGYD